MSASLVGSEMCIRDRAPAGPPRQCRRERNAAHRIRNLCEQTADSPKRSHCLLYTSDAADDM
eukprot:14868019-Alexandrium_andersonii.AAC.1